MFLKNDLGLLYNGRRVKFEKFAPHLQVLIHHGSNRYQDENEFQTVASHKDIVITSFTLVRKDLKLFNSQSWQRLVIDEAQNIKNPKAAQTKAILSLSAQQSAQKILECNTGNADSKHARPAVEHKTADQSTPEPQLKSRILCPLPSSSSRTSPPTSSLLPAGAIAVAYFAFRWLIRTGSLERR